MNNVSLFNSKKFRSLAEFFLATIKILDIQLYMRYLQWRSKRNPIHHKMKRREGGGLVNI